MTASGSATKLSIARAARALFEVRGYDASIREIAAEAGVDPALVIRHFGSKDELFVRVVGFDEYFAPQFDGPLDTIGERLVGYLLDPGRAQLRRAFTTLVRASNREAVRAGLRDSMSRRLVHELNARMTGDDSLLRAWLVSAQIVGLVQSWEAVQGDTADAENRAQVVALYGAAIQRLITP